MSERNIAALITHERPVPVNANVAHQQKLSPLDRFGVTITRLVGTMVCALLFTVLAFISFPAAIKTHDLIVIVAWIAQTFLQLVLLPIIMVGQNIQGRHSETMADEEFKTTKTTYKDLEHLMLLNHEQLDLLLELAQKKKPAAS